MTELLNKKQDAEAVDSRSDADGSASTSDKRETEWPEVYANAVKKAEDLIDDPDNLIDVDEIMEEVERHNADAIAGKKVPFALKIVGVVSILGSLVGIADGVMMGLGFWLLWKNGYFVDYSTTTLVVTSVMGVALFALVVMLLVLGVRLLRISAGTPPSRRGS